VIDYETDIDLLRKVVPEPLEATSNVVKYEFIRMPSYGQPSPTRCPPQRLPASVARGCEEPPLHSPHLLRLSRHVPANEKPIAASILARRTSAFLQTALSDLLRSISVDSARLSRGAAPIEY
jgi:hypothetical protein